MNFVGIDLHKKSMSVCVVSQERKVRQRRNFRCQDPERIREFFEGLEPFQAVVEATATYEWLVSLIEPLAQRVAMAREIQRHFSGSTR